MLLPALFHWSPADRFDEIYRHGLRPHSAATVATTMTLPYVCLSPTASAAWALSGAMGWVSEVDEWDLWQVRLADGDHVEVRAEFGPVVQEVKVRGPVPADRVWWVGRRISSPANTAIEMPAPARAARARAGAKKAAPAKRSRS